MPEGLDPGQERSGEDLAPTPKDILSLIQRVKGGDDIVSDEEGSYPAATSNQRDMKKVEMPETLRQEFGKKAKVVIGGDSEAGYVIHIINRRAGNQRVYDIDTDYPTLSYPRVQVAEYSKDQIEPPKKDMAETTQRGTSASPPTELSSEQLLELNTVLTNAINKYGGAKDSPTTV